MAEVAVTGSQALPFQGPCMVDNKGTIASTPTTGHGRPRHDLPQFSFSPASASSEHGDDEVASGRPTDAALSDEPGDGVMAVDRPLTHRRQPSHALPAFTFNPAAADTTFPPPRAVTPPYAPTFEAPTTPTRGGRHRRSASEFIGGHGISRSIANSESIQANVAQSNGSADAIDLPPVSPSKRGHRHKRSTAISQDLSNLPRPSTARSQFDRAEPVPSIPEQVRAAAGARPATPLRRSPHSYPQTAISDNTISTRNHTPSPPPRPASQIRVGFSDVVEVIPRPISLVSTGSDTSLSTIMSVGAADSHNFSPVSSPALHARRPSGPIGITPTSAPIQPSPLHRPSTPFTAQSEDRHSDFGLTDTNATLTSAAQQPHESTESSLLQENEHDHDDNDEFFEPPANPDDDPTSVIISPSSAGFTSSYIPMSFDSLTSSPAVDEYNESSGTMIDLDAALGPFKTPSAGLDGGSAKGRGFASARRIMHSSGTPFHRRTESAPTLVPMKYDAADVLVRPTSERGFQMDNVFEEEEEEGEEDSTAHDATPRESPTRRQDPRLAATKQLSWPLDGSDINKDSHSDQMEGIECISASYTTTSSDSTIEASTTTSGILKSNPPNSSSSSRNAPHPPFLAPYANVAPDTPTTSSYPSAPGSATDESFQMHRLDTVGSSNTEGGRRHHFIGFGGSGSELRQSVDDVPSLISCGSTATSTIYNNPPSTSSRSFVGPRISAGSSLSISSSAAAAERRRKRSSIASLSRLMTGPFMDKSSISLDQGIPRCVTSDGLRDPHPPADKKPRKLGRLFKFWKTSKDSSSTRTNVSSPLK